MSNGANHNCSAIAAAVSTAGSPAYAGDTPATARRHIRHIYVHIPFCARICPYCAFYKDLLDRARTWRFCEAILDELADLVGKPRRGVRSARCAEVTIRPSTISLGGCTLSGLNIVSME